MQGGAIHNILVIAEKEGLGRCLEEVLRDHGCHVTIAESYGTFGDVVRDIARKEIDLVIATNSCFPAVRIKSIVPDIKARHPLARIIVLSGYSPPSFQSDVLQMGVDAVLPLPFEENTLLREVDRTLLKSTR